ncbi:MAG TPA: hypothetical protein VN843_09780 [Anaerolineales bacterium]|nr:hypothetical protein [Anaerolineales bacterium]
MSAYTQPYASLQEFAELIAKALGSDWKRSTRFDSEDSNWRAELEGPGSQCLFLSNLWAREGRLYIGGSFPQGAQLPYKAEVPSITVDAHKSAQQIARDITSRLLPRYTPLLETVLDSKTKAEEFEAGRQRLAAEVAIVVNGRVNGEVVYSHGWDLQVSGPDSIRVQGHCNYLTLDQLKKIQAVCPELFKGKE